jgi:hypothetical protein
MQVSVLEMLVPVGQAAMHFAPTRDGEPHPEADQRQRRHNVDEVGEARAP